ncbi:hypothetical protein V495_04944 [Pseudogymnoascus sp. VKM F-4514 (FW-929)]|nr:hypothetical protein V495_04944 [Pseudogymnoascus sp. VKM F-4514 (FW-929)]KFY58155.1 hypothetical protein V497_05018 [Pseudogymnoascus sp. VKM F-4516 (FW-969)]
MDVQPEFTQHVDLPRGKSYALLNTRYKTGPVAHKAPGSTRFPASNDADEHPTSKETLVAAADALIARTAPCCFHLSASGAVTGTIGQLDDGQNRQGGGLPPAQYCISGDSITDANGRGCILTPPTTQFQCDEGAAPTPGFSVGCDGTLSYNGSPEFWECQTGDHGEANIYTSEGGTNCGKITLKADGCASGCPPPPPPPPPVTTCPTNLNGPYEFPHLIIPVDSSKPDTAPGTSYFGTVSSTVSSIFNFDIPAADSGKKCSLIFLFPTQDQLETSSFTISGDGGLDFSRLSGVATGSTTFNNQPGVATDYGVTTVSPGNSYNIATFDCPAGTAVSFEIKASGDTSLNYFQDYNPSPIGLYITTC